MSQNCWRNEGSYKTVSWITGETGRTLKQKLTSFSSKLSLTATSRLVLPRNRLFSTYDRIIPLVYSGSRAQGLARA